MNIKTMRLLFFSLTFLSFSSCRENKAPIPKVADEQLEMERTQEQTMNLEKNISDLDEGVTGTITDIHGKILVGALITPISLEATNPPIPEIAVTSDSNGRFKWKLAPGKYQLTVSIDGYLSKSMKIEIKAKQVQNADFKLEKMPH